MTVARFAFAAVFCSALTASAQDGGVAAPAAPPADPPQLIRVYGAVKPSVVFSSAAVESYSQPNAVAMTAAGNPVLSTVAGHSRLAFEVGQSRFGFMVGEGSPFRGQIEFDFVDFTKAAPTVASVPRVRIAKLAWLISPTFSVHAGQDWDVVQPLNPHGINWVGGLFQAGNQGFMRQQVKAIGLLGNIEIAGAVGLQNNNNTAKDGAVEIGLVPTVAMHVQMNLGANGKIGVSAIGTSLSYKLGTPDESHTFAGMTGLYGDLTFSGFNLRAEGYFAKNGANLFLLGLSQGRAGAGKSVTDVREAGGFLSMRLPVGIAGIYGMFGAAAVLNPDNLAASYTYPGTIDPANPPATSTATAAGTGPGILLNMSARLGVDVKIFKGLSWLAEGFWMRTNHKLLAIDEGRVQGLAQSFWRRDRVHLHLLNH